MSPLVDLLTTFRATGDPLPLAGAIPYLRFMGIRFERHDDVMRGVMPFAEHIVGNPTLPALHGGSLGALLEATAIVQTLWEADTLLLPKTINITVDYLRSGRPIDTFARAIVTKHGRRVINVRAEAWQDDVHRPIATAQAHFLVKTAE